MLLAVVAILASVTIAAAGRISPSPGGGSKSGGGKEQPVPCDQRMKEALLEEWLLQLSCFSQVAILHFPKLRIGLASTQVMSLTPAEYQAVGLWTSAELGGGATDSHSDAPPRGGLLSDFDDPELAALEEWYPVVPEMLVTLKTTVLAIRNEILKCAGRPEVDSIDMQPKGAFIDDQHIVVLQAMQNDKKALLLALPPSQRRRFLRQAYLDQKRVAAASELNQFTSAVTPQRPLGLHAARRHTDCAACHQHALMMGGAHKWQ